MKLLVLKNLMLSLVLLGAVVSGCGHPQLEMMFNTSTEAYPISTDDSGASALAALGVSQAGMTATSVVRIKMNGVGEENMRSIHLHSLVLVAKEGGLEFVQVAKCYVQSQSDPSKQPILVGKAGADRVSEDGKSVKFEVEEGVELAGVLKSPFVILVEIEGGIPTQKVSVSGELTFKAQIQI